ncbi:MAG: LamG-like jellyroll fold domain-containing protein, partial [Limisphaerales bacterium]
TVNGDGQIHNNPQHLPERGEIRWELDNTGVVSFKVATGAKHSAERWDIAATPRVLKEDQMGQWSLLATTYDSKSGAVVHFWNGRPVSKSIMFDAAPLAFEFLELGNPNLSDAELKEGQRYGFFGAMDELLISRRLLTPSEIAEFYLSGKPSS